MILLQPSALAYIPKRVISLVPSQTELLHHLGLYNETVAITKFCVHPPEWFKTKIQVGGTKNLDIKRIKELQPDLVIANKEENTKEQVEELAKDVAVWVTDVNNFNDALSMIDNIGLLTGRISQAQQLIKSIKNEFTSIHQPGQQVKTAYLIWRKPYMTVGGDTFIGDMLEQCGLQNIFSGLLRYPQVTVEQLQASGCQLLLLSSEPYPFKEKHIAELQQHLPGTKIIIADGEMFSWYGSRMLYMPQYLNRLLKNIKTC